MSVQNPLINPNIYRWTGVFTASILGVSSGLLLFLGTYDWLKRLVKPAFGLPMFIGAPLHAIALIMAGFAVQIVMGNVSGNPAVKPARKSFSIWLWIHGLWALLFGAFHFPVLALGVAIVQWGAAVFCIQKFYNVDPRAGQRLTPFFIATTYWMLYNGWLLSLNNNL